MEQHIETQQNILQPSQPWQNLKSFKEFMRIKYSCSLQLIKMQTNCRNFKFWNS